VCQGHGQAHRPGAYGGAVLTEPRDLDQAELEQFLERRWGLRDPTLDYLPVGFGSHHWRCDSQETHSFVSVDDLEAGFQAGPDADAAFAALDRAFRTAAALRNDAGLEFVVAPLPDDEGLVLCRLSDRYAVRVSPLVEGGSSGFGRLRGSRGSPPDGSRAGTSPRCDRERSRRPPSTGGLRASLQSCARGSAPRSRSTVGIRPVRRADSAPATRQRVRAGTTSPRLRRVGRPRARRLGVLAALLPDRVEGGARAVLPAQHNSGAELFEVEAPGLRIRCFSCADP